jgi:hypothetical protein
MSELFGVLGIADNLRVINPALLFDSDPRLHQNPLVFCMFSCLCCFNWLPHSGR